MIRKVQTEDAEAIAAIYNHYIAQTTITFETEPVSTEEMKRRILSISRNYPYWIYEEKGEIAGYCYAHQWKEKEAYQCTAETTIYIKPEYTGKGIGKKMMLHLTNSCRERNLHTLIACITYPNEASMHLHEQLGFQLVSHFHEVGRKFDQWLDVCDYELHL